MSTKVKIVLVILAVGIITAVIVWKYTFKNAENSVASQKATIETSADKLVHDFESNEDSANAKYLDKIIIVSGTVDSVTQDNLGVSVYLKNKGDMSSVQCGFDKSAVDRASVKKGLSIKIKGKCNGYLLLTGVVMNKCVVVK